MAEKTSLRDLAKMIDHSLLHPTMTDSDLEAGCRLALKYDVATACIKPYAIPLARGILKGSGVLVCPVIAFPHGNSATAVKVREAELAVEEGGAEIDMVINIGKAMGGDWKYVSDEVAAINRAVTGKGAILKVIFENDYLNDEQIVKLCEICAAAKVAYVKTSSGYGFVKQPDGNYNYKGATDHHLKLMRRHCPSEVKIKAAGGVRTLDDMLRVRALGVARIGATATAVILEEARKRGYS